MKDRSLALIALLVIWILLVILAGCDGSKQQSYTIKVFEKAKALCDPNKGVRRLILHTDKKQVDVVCKNGAKFFKIN